ncbi:Putative RxLR effector [Phytophthora palmivora]|uniref:RxLR effector protein n=1 Tax=Phytophthora palmivora TaxID=4796 RepID=A0A2P4WWP5_9STRA|nr:Putative RxLR effector [Phytophthora palmivora]
MRVLLFFLVVASAVLARSEALAETTDSTKISTTTGHDHLRSQRLAETRGLRSYVSTSKRAKNEENEERMFPSPYRVISIAAEKLGYTKYADDMLVKAWNAEGKTSSDALKELNMKYLKPGEMNARDMDLYNTFSKMVNTGTRRT